VTATVDRAPRVGLSRLTDPDLALLLLIRRFEEALLDLFSQGLISGTVHCCLGQEYIPVALSALWRADDVIFSNHRGHGHYLARFRDPDGLLAEVMGRDGAVCGGVGGSQHIHRDGYLSTGVQGESMPVAAGVALHLRGRGRGQLAVVFIGDGTWGEGAVYETLNVAALWHLPLLVVVENNHIAQSTPRSSAMAGTIAGRAAAFGIAYHHLSTMDVNVIRDRLAPVVTAMRATSAPVVVEFDTVRLGPHSKGDDTRDPVELHRARANDWCARYREAFPEQFTDVDARQRRAIADLVHSVRSRGLAVRER